MRTTCREKLGYWLMGCVVVTILLSLLNLAIWSKSRTTKEERDGWTRTVIDQDLSYFSTTHAWILGGFLLLWTVVSIAYWMIEEEGK